MGSSVRILSIALLVLTGPSAPWEVWGAADTAERLYTTALADERRLRQPGSQPGLLTLRATVSDYETVVTRFPASAFAEHALWQAAGLAMYAYDLYRELPDHDTTRRFLTSLGANYPEGRFSSRVTEELRQLDILADVALVKTVHREADGHAARVTITLDREVKFDAHELADPAVVYIDLHWTHPSVSLRDTSLDFGDDFVVPSIRTGRYPGHLTRVVLDTAEADECLVDHADEPFRILIECDASRVVRDRTDTPSDGRPRATARFVGAAFGAAVAPPAPADGTTLTVAEPSLTTSTRLRPIPGRAGGPEPTRARRYSLARQLGLGVSRVVIDPGHGGRDPGARAAPLKESDVVLDIAKRLERRLRNLDPPIDVVLTRRDDTYVPLEARAMVANRAGADLFVSIHANASDKPSVRGIATYSLNFATDTQAEATASRENVSGRRTMANLDELLEAIAVDSKVDESRALARTVQTAMVRSLRVADPDIPDLGVKEAPFVVLIGARMPSILTEVSFLTNGQDAALLQTNTYRERIAGALFEGIWRYRRELSGSRTPRVAEAGGF